MNRIREFCIRLARRAIFSIDTLQRKRHHVYEFDGEPRCMLRISRCANHEDRVLSDGAIVRSGDAVIEFHFWNERVPIMGPKGPDMAWGLKFYRSAVSSLEDLAGYIYSTEEYDDVVALRAESSFASGAGWDRYASFFNRLGFDFLRHPPATPSERAACFFINLYVWIIIWLLNPASLRGKPLTTAERAEVWISRSALLERYGTKASSRRPAGAKYRQPSAVVYTNNETESCGERVTSSPR